MRVLSGPCPALETLIDLLLGAAARGNCLLGATACFGKALVTKLFREETKYLFLANCQARQLPVSSVSENNESRRNIPP